MKKITMIDEVHCQANKEARKVIKHALSYKASHWKQGRFAMEQHIANQHLISGRGNTSGKFLTGLLPRIKKYAKERDIKLDIEINREKIKPDSNPKLGDIIFRKDQKRAIRKAKARQRGVITAPTGSGKTIVAYGIVSMFKYRRIIFVVHTTEIWSQLKAAAWKYQLDLPPIWTPSGSKEVRRAVKDIRKNSNGILICLIQSLAKVDPRLYADVFDVTMIDECHHVVDESSQYGKFMRMNLSPRRYGFTASLPTKRKQILISEGLIGPIIANLSMEEGIQKGIIAKPKVQIINVPYNTKINKKAENTFSGYYKYGIIENKYRNNAIREVVEKAYKRKRTILIIVEKLDHGRNIQNIINRRSSINIHFIHGNTRPELRTEFMEKMIDGTVNGIIASRIWMEGVNIPNLRFVVYAAGMKEKKKTLQAMGRGLRTAYKKKRIILIDFLDPYKYLAEHSIQRLQTYNEQKWL